MPKNPDWIDWRNSAAREIILEDLEPGGLIHGKDDFSPSELFGFYKLFPEFEKVVLSQFEARLADHRKLAAGKLKVSAEEEEMLEHDRKLYPRQAYNQRGEPVFDMSPAKLLLREDVKNKLHETMTPAALQQKREEYWPFKPEIFCQRIYQEVRRAKYLFYLDIKRKVKQTKYSQEQAKQKAKAKAKQKKEEEKKEREAAAAEAKKSHNEQPAGGIGRKKGKNQTGKGAKKAKK